MIYFDHNATAPLLPQARLAWLNASEEFIGNPSSPHRLGSRAARALELARERLAGVLGCDPLEILWTSGATESNNLVLHQFSQLERPGAVLVSAIEHPSVLEPARNLFGKKLQLIPVCPSGVIDLDWLEQNMKKLHPALVAVMAANNETGVLQPWKEALRICREASVPFFCDAVQWVGKLPLRELGACDFVSTSAHKFGGPRGVGFLKCPEKLRPLLRGGKQEGGRRAGTENLPGVLAMLAALEFREKQIADGEHELRLCWRQTFEKSLTLPGCQWIGAKEERLWNTISVLMPPLLEKGVPVRWVVKLDKAGFAVSSGSACSSGQEGASHVLAAMGIPGAEASRVVRISSGWETTEEEWKQLAEAVSRLNAGG